MQPFTVLTAIAAPYERLNVDTDQILPARFLLKRRTDPQYPTYLFRDLRLNPDGSEHPDFVLNHPAYRAAQIFVGNANFGGGSSREAAAIAFDRYGIRCVIAVNFGDIVSSLSSVEIICKNKYLQIFLIAIAFAGAPCEAAYPDKPLRLVAPNPAGSVTDILARPLAMRLTEAWGVPVVVDNRPGAGGNLAGEIVAKAPPDGLTLLMGNIGILMVNPFLYTRMPFDAQRAFAPVTLTATAGMLLVVHPSTPAHNVKELIALAKARPGHLTYPSSGMGSTPHLAAALFLSMTNTTMIHVAYKGSPQYVIDLLTGRLELAFASMANVIPHIKTGRLRLLATTMDKRDPQFPHAPTIAEAGVPGYDMRAWYGLLSTAGTPQVIIDKLNAESARILTLPEVKTQYLVGGLHATSSSAAEFASYIASERDKWTKVVKSAGIRGE